MTYKPDVKTLAEAFAECVNRRRQSEDLNRDARYNYWPGQHYSGRKETPRTGETEIFPWKGASDVRIPLVDSYVNEDVAMLMVGMARSRLTAGAVETSDIGNASHVTNIIRWLLFEQMPERWSEACLLANNFLERGKGVLGVFWERRTQMGYQTLSAEELTQFSQTMAEKDPASPGAMLAPIILDPAIQVADAVPVLTEQINGLVASHFAKHLGEYASEVLTDYNIKPAAVAGVIRDLREKGSAQVPIPTILRNSPGIVALTLDEDFFLPADATDLKTARCCFWLEWMTESSLRERVVSEDWDERWVNYVLDHGKGAAVTAGLSGSMSQLSASSASYQGVNQQHGRSYADVEELYGIVHGFERRCDDNGVPGIHYTVFHPACVSETGVKEHAKCELLNYTHGQYPFVLFRREYLSRRVDDSRGYGEIAFTWQNQIKAEADMQIDRSSLATLPPLHHPAGRPPAKWGPGVRVPGVRNQYFFADIPQWDPGTLNVEQRMRMLSDKYFGRQTKDADPSIAPALRQMLMDGWLEGWRQAITQIYQLAQQFLPNEFYYRVIGNKNAKPVRASREEIQGKFDVRIGFNVGDLNPEELQAKLEAIKTVVSELDVNGIIDRDELVAIVFEWIDPNLGERLIKPGESASQQEIEDEQNVFAQISAGVDVDIKPGQAYQLRLQTLQQILSAQDDKGKPRNKDVMDRLQKDESFRARIEKRVQQLQHQLEQRENAKIGRLGA